MFNFYSKPGKGVSENEPEKSLPALYFSVLWRKLRKFIGINLLYLICTLPIVAISLYAISPILMSFGMSWNNANIYLSAIMMYLVFIGIAPINIGVAAVFKQYSRQEHSWVVKDFLSTIKENFGVCIKLLLIDLVFTIVLLADFYLMPAFEGWMYVIVSITTYFAALVYISSHFFIYQIILMFDVSAVSALKNAVIIAIAKLPQCLLLFAVMLFVGVIINNPFTFLLLGFAPLSFASNLYAERLLTKKYIDNKSE
ncbi:MAG: hypothetical protein PHE51_06360 [Eubacteriales bacterium]|nr:hypothetical protein [Eubacteriales bacterium]